MQNKIKVLLNQMGLEEEFYSYFDGASLEKIVGNKTKDSFNFYIKIDKILLSLKYFKAMFLILSACL